MTTYSESGSCCSSDRPELRQMRTANGQTDITLNRLNPVFSRVCADVCHIPKITVSNKSSIFSAY
ncbi:hypothetical protein ALO40_102777 [Pseudomonas syringae pv. viburni]|uniref:Uncharacterized protein n=1 Tax=Pseudomonas syringae pv. viburni TaxID=251703 RepID=A0A0Q0DB83_9PSED|nr:hypothetical protein ALO40_102777 [Pseudomonas syringae pv. viburni]